MIIVKILLLALVAISFTIIASMNKYKILNKIIIVFFFFLSAYFIVFPTQSDVIASLLDIKSGSNLVIYISVSLLFLFVVSLFSKVKRQDRVNTKLIRLRTLDNCVKTSK
tara:strand:+ start:1533 stop:1862 length:330 start_codon:yes stop_codon:yes gene_type:complete